MNKIRFSELICKIIIKAHLSNTGIKLCAPINHKYSSFTLDEALGILGAKSPRPEGEILRPIHMLTDTPQYDLQIIVPAYNVEKYIIQCIKSICKQTTEYNWQAIIIDDGSKDKTGELIDRYRNNKRIKIIHQKNLGFSGARNTGLSFVNSKYVMFLDSDDFLEKNAIKILLEEAFKYDADVVEGNFYYYKNKKKKPGSFHKLGEVKHPIDTLLGFPWGKIIKSKLLQSYQFPKNYWFEDTIMSFLIYPQCKRARTVSDYVYSYRINNQGITNTL